SSKGFSLAILVVATFGASSRPVHAAGRPASDQANIDYVERRYPGTLELLEQGEANLHAGDLKSALAIFKDVKAKATPSSLATRRRCQTLGELGDETGALAACADAVTAGNSIADQRAYTAAVTMGKGPHDPRKLWMALELVEGAAKRDPQQ